MTEPAATSARLDDIAQAAARLFLDKGYDAASMADLAAATGLGKSSLYHHLTSKDQLLAHICDRTIAELRQGLDDIASGPGDAGDRLTAALAHVTRTALSDIPAANLILTVKPTTETARRVLDQRNQIERALAELITAAQAEGQARTDVEPHLLTRLVMGTINGLVAWYRPDASDIAPEAVRSAVLSLMLAALKPTST